MKRIFTIHKAVMALFAAVVAMTSCSSGDTGRKSIAVSLPPHAALLHEITGDSIDIITLMESDANPEAFEVTVKNMRAVSDADIYMKAGYLAFEETLTDRIGEANKSLKFIDISQGIAPVYGTHSHAGHSHTPAPGTHRSDKSDQSDQSDSSTLTDRSDLSDLSDMSDMSDSPNNSHSHSNLAADPHTWTSVANLKVIATNMLEAVKQVDPANNTYYTANYQRLIHRLDSIDASLSHRLGASGTKAFLIWHPSLSYFARDYGLDQIPLGQDNKEMTPGQLRDIHQRAADEGVKVIFIQKNFDASQAETVARELGLTVVRINPLDNDYIRQFNIITDALAQ